MSHDLPVSRIPAIPGSATSSPPTTHRTEENAPAPAKASPFPNPTLRLDPSLGMVVLEFLDESGKVTSTIPSERILEAYRSHAAPAPEARPTPPASTPSTGEGDPAERFA